MEVTARTVPVRKATAADAAKASETLTRGFFDDPVMTWAVPDVERRIKVSPPMWDVFVERFLPLGELHTTEDGDGVALWAPPGANAFDGPAGEEAGMRLAEILGPDGERFGILNEVMETNHPHDPHFYLNLLSTVPERQGQGLGSSLLRAVLSRCDAEGHAAYLEATSERNRALYLRHGFEVTRELELPDDGPTLYAMWRDPS